MIAITDGSIFHLATDNSSYIMHILPSGHAEHIYYGRKLSRPVQYLTTLMEKRYTRQKNATYYSDEDTTLSLDDVLLEFSAEGKGDYRIPLVAVSAGENGERTADFRYKGYMRHEGIAQISGLPQAKADKTEAESLLLVFEDEKLGLTLTLTYTIFPELDAIVRKSSLKASKSCIIRSLASSQLDFRSDKIRITAFSGAWGREFERYEKVLDHGTFVSESRQMGSSAEANPGFLIEDGTGGFYAMNLVYSGPHRASFSETVHGIAHIVWGINPDQFSWPLDEGESFDSPEAVMVFADDRTDCTERMHRFINTCIIRSIWSEKLRPLMMSTESALSYAVTEGRVLAMAKAAKSIGMEGIIIGDGWFGSRSSVKTSIGDWFPNTMKFPSGLFELSQDIHRLGLLFGLWIEPEGISGKSMLYKEHPDWIIGHSDAANAKGSHENLLDLTRSDVRAWLIDTISSLIDRCRVDYLKWDISRMSSDLFSHQGIEDYGMFMHKYIQGLYKVIGTIGRRFPSMYIETSAAGGGRFDLGMMCYSASISISDNSDPLCLAKMIASASMLYPPSVISASFTPSPNQITDRIADRETRFNTAAFSSLQYSIDTSSLSAFESEAYRKQIEFYKTYRNILQGGRFRLQEDGNRIIWTVSDKNRSMILLLYFQKLLKPNTTAEKLYVEDADPNSEYIVMARPHTLSDQELSYYPQETECYKSGGDILRWAGIPLVDQVSGNGYKDGMRMLGDFSSRLYLIRRTKSE